MNNKTKQTIYIIALSLLGSCLLLNNAGLAPTGSMSGSEFGKLLQGTGSTAFQFGVTNYCATRGDAVACVDALGGSVAGGMLLAGVGLRSNVEFENDTYYTSASIDECDRRVRWEMILVTQSLLSGAAGGGDPAGVNASDLTAAALSAAAYGAQRCQLEPVGNLISVGDVNL